MGPTLQNGALKLTSTVENMDPKKNRTVIPGVWAGHSKGGCYLPGIHPTEGTSIHLIYTGKSPRPED